MQSFEHKDKIYQNDKLVIFLDDEEKHLKEVFDNYINTGIADFKSKILQEVLDIKEYIIYNYGHFAMLQFLKHSKAIVEDFDCGWGLSAPGLKLKKELMIVALDNEQNKTKELLIEYFEYDIERCDSLEKLNLLINVISDIQKNDELKSKLVSTLLQNFMSTEDYYLQENDIKNIIERLNLNDSTKSTFLTMLESSVKAKISEKNIPVSSSRSSTADYLSITNTESNLDKIFEDDDDDLITCTSDDDLITCVDPNESIKSLSDELDELDEFYIADLFEIKEEKTESFTIEQDNTLEIKDEIGEPVQKEKFSDFFIKFIKKLFDMFIDLKLVTFVLNAFKAKEPESAATLTLKK